jgi:tetratricopeptide (TPR) repeat protein
VDRPGYLLLVLTAARRAGLGALCAALLSALLAAGCFRAAISDNRDEAFNQGVEALQGGDYALAASAAWEYLKGGAKTDPLHDRALKLLAESAERMGLTYAASLWYLDIAESRRNPELVPAAMRALERIVTAGAHDHEVLVGGFIATADLSRLPPDVQPFVDFEQGLMSLRQGHQDWAAGHFAQIPPGSRYFHRAKYTDAVRLVAGGDLEGAKARMRDILAAKDLPVEIELKARRSLARLHFEAGEHLKALEQYEAQKQLAPGDPELVLEMAWVSFHLNDIQRALGLLIALDAPVYRDLIAPERFLLEALCLQRLCQFDLSRRAAVRLRERHGRAIDDIYSGRPLMESEDLRAAARLKSGGPPSTKLSKLVLREKRTLHDLSERLTPDLAKTLSGIYAAGAVEAARREADELKRGVAQVARELLDAEEGVRLLLHELSVALQRGQRRAEGPGAGREAADGAAHVVRYRFDGEFWTDEIDDLLVLVEDRCVY